ncbi:thymidine kinase [Rhodoferax antarcticus]|uniref:Thymidine kinase n=1 Tax=Rhodoferax antarcticus ANT.BR TaxID=1111071 RepID=A0A1Q8Y906_9BURK|nr:thymidine kinase [Rhodoferax antarcticus]OLP04536.1 thymidine kinase [Rhodoferax antarcticus ANT.BR]
MAKLHYRYASMNAGKSTQLLQVAYNYTEGGHKVRLFTAKIDDRLGTGVIGSRLGVTREAEVYDESTVFDKLLKRGSDLACVLIDEAQFLTPTQVHELHFLVHDRNLPIMCFGLRSDFMGIPFPGSMRLLSLAEDISELKAICACGHKSTMQIRLDDDGVRVRSGDTVLIGGNNRYRQVCAACFYST